MHLAQALVNGLRIQRRIAKAFGGIEAAIRLEGLVQAGENGGGVLRTGVSYDDLF
jgi:hypothetical protein